MVLPASQEVSNRLSHTDTIKSQNKWSTGACIGPLWKINHKSILEMIDPIMASSVGNLVEIT